MPKVEQETARTEVLAKLNDAEREKFYKLEELLKSPNDDDLTWHHGIGKFIVESGLAGKVALNLLSHGCGFSDNTFGRKVRLYRDFNAKEVERLQKWRIPFGVLVATVIVSNSDERWKVLLQAKENRWTEPELRGHLKSKYSSPHRHGGRPRKKPQAYSDEVNLDRLIRLSQTWLENYAAVWKEMRASKKLKILMTKVTAALGELVKAAERQSRPRAKPKEESG